jgi:hypothetical protein
MKLCRENPILFKIEINMGHPTCILLTSIRNILQFGNDVKVDVLLPVRDTTSVFLHCWQWHVAKQNTHKALLLSHYNNGYTSYIITLSCSVLKVDTESSNPYLAASHNLLPVDPVTRHMR